MDTAPVIACIAQGSNPITIPTAQTRPPQRRTRYLIPMLAAASAFLCLLFIASTVHVYIQPHSDSYSALVSWFPTRQTTIVVSDGIDIAHTTDAVEHNTRYPNVRRATNGRLLGFRFELVRQVLYPRWISHGDNQTIEWGPAATWSLSVPGWASIALSAILPIRWIAALRRRRQANKIAAGICLRCGYDLRASPARCPECSEPRPQGAVASPTRPPTKRR